MLILLVSSAPVDPSRLARALDGASAVLSVHADDDLLGAVARGLRVFTPDRVVLAGPDLCRDWTGLVEDRFGRPVFAVAGTR